MRTEDPGFAPRYVSLPAGHAVEWIVTAHPWVQERMEADPVLRDALEAVGLAGPWLTRLCVNDPLSIEVLSRLDEPVEDVVARTGSRLEGGPYARVRRMKDLGVLRIAARDLLGMDGLEDVGRGLSELAGDLLDEALASARPSAEGLAIVALGKLGASELNYASDIDLLLVGPEADAQEVGGAAGELDPRPFLELARSAWRVDLDLRPEGRAGAMVRTLRSYRAYWARWAEAWEFQALLKARPVAGDPELGDAFARAAAEEVWGRPFGADELRQLRRMKARAETELVRRNLLDREIKRGRGGIRDIEFAVQLLQLVHGRSDPSLRVPSTLDALGALASGGYVSLDDAQALAAAYRFLRTVEHRLQLYEGQQVHTLPSSEERVYQLALVMGYRHDGNRSAEQQFDEDLRRHRLAARSIHERLFFRPLLEAFTAPPTPLDTGVGALPEQAVAERLAAFGFADAARTAQAVSELTRGFSRMSQLMQRTLPLLLDWLSASPDPDLGLLGLRVLASGTQSRDRLVTVCRESPVGAQQLCLLLGTGPRFARDFQRHPESLAGLASGHFPGPAGPADLRPRAVGSLSWRSGAGSAEIGLRQFAQAEKLRIAARDVLGIDDYETTGRALSDLADSVIAAAVDHLRPPIPLAIIGMGRLGGREVGYDSDVDLLIVWDELEDEDQELGPEREEQELVDRADTTAMALARLIGGGTPATGAYRVDLNLRPEGRHGAAARSIQAYAAYYERWARPWERQALLRSRFVAGDPDVGAKFARLVQQHVWDRPLTAADELEIRRTKARMEKERVPAGEDPKFHLKLGPGSLSDVEWTVQLLQMRHKVAEAGTMAALGRLVEAGALGRDAAEVLGESYRFCAQTRNRLSLTRDVPGDSLPVTGPALSVLARSLGHSASGLRNEYTRVTRRARRVVERHFYNG